MKFFKIDDVNVNLDKISSFQLIGTCVSIYTEDKTWHIQYATNYKAQFLFSELEKQVYNSSLSNAKIHDDFKELTKLFSELLAVGDVAIKLLKETNFNRENWFKVCNKTHKIKNLINEICMELSECKEVSYDSMKKIVEFAESFNIEKEISYNVEDFWC